MMRRADFSSNQPSGYEPSVAGASLSGWEHADQLESGQWGVLTSVARQLPASSYLPVQPNRTTNPMGSWPCEQLTAEIENKTSVAILADQYDEVCGRLMQVKKNHLLFKGVASIELAVVLMNVFLSATANTQGAQMRHGFAAILGVMSGTPHMGVALQFQRIKRTCEDALRSRFGDSFFRKLDSFGRDEDGFQKAIHLLREQGVPTGFLDQKLAEFQARGYSHSWVAQVLMNVAP